MLVKLRELVGGLRVYPENMKRNLEMTKGLYFSQSILLALTRAGLARKTAYEAVQRAAMKTWRGKKSFAENVKAERANHGQVIRERDRQTLLTRDPFPSRRRKI